MDSPLYTLRTLTADDAARYNAFLAEGTRRHPTTLRIAPEDLAAAPFATAPSDDGCTLVAEAPGGQWLGVGSVERERGRVKRRHVAWVMRMLVASPGAGVGRTLLTALQQRAAAMPGVDRVNLTVAAHNASAVHLYTSVGFVTFSREPDAFRVGGESIEELSMAWVVRPA